MSLNSHVTFGEAFRFWLKLGFISFGGPAGQIAIMQRELVENRKWIDQDDFLHALNYCMLLPGPEAQQLATYIGWRLHGIKGGIVAGALFVIPSIFFLLILSYIYAAYGNVPQIVAVLDGFKAVVVAIVVEAVIKIGKKAFKTYWHVLISAVAFAAIYFFHVPFPLIVLGAAIVGFLSSRFKVQSPKSEESKEQSPIANHKSQIWQTIFVCLGLWFLPFLAIVLWLGFGTIATNNYLFFTQAAFVTFGGAYSNHIYSTAAACHELGLKSIGIIRGEEIKPLNETLAFAHSMGMQFEFISREAYRKKTEPDFLKSRIL